MSIVKSFSALLIASAATLSANPAPTTLTAPAALTAPSTLSAPWALGSLPSTSTSTSPSTSAAASPLLYVCNQNDATVSVVDPASGQVVRVVDLKALGFSANAKPHHVLAEADGSFWYVTLIGDNRIVKLDRNDKVVAQATFETPGMMAIHPTKDLLFVGRSMTAVNPPARIGVLRRSDLKLEEIDVLFPRPHAMVVEPKSGTVYTASLATNQIAAVNPETEQVEITSVPGDPHALMQFAISPDGKTLAVSGELSSKVLLFDVTDHMKPKLVAEIPVEHQPFDPIFTPDGRYVVLANKAANAVTLIDPKQHKVAAVITGEGLAQPHGTVISRDGKFAYVSNNNLKGTGDHAMHQMVGGSQGAPAAPAGPGRVVVIDLAARKITRVIDVGHNAAGLSLVAQ